MCKWQCEWCLKIRRSKPKKEQKDVDGVWRPYCGPCKGKMENPYNNPLSGIIQIEIRDIEN